MSSRNVESFEVAQLVEQYVTDQLADAEKYSNREPLDTSGTYDLHSLAAKIYALGFNEGTAVEGWRQSQDRMRDRARKRDSEEADHE